MTSTQLGSALIGGQARVQLSIAANVLPTNQFRINAFPNLVVSVALPAGVTVAAAENPAWSCTAQGMCTVSSLVSGSASTAVLKLRIDSTAQSPIEFAPTVIAPANAIVQSTPLSIVAVSVPGLVFQEFERGSVAAVGNTVLDCSKECTYVGGDVKTATINASTADLSFTGTVAKAVLVWSGDGATADRNTVRLLTPAGAVDVVADNVAEGYGSAYADAFVAYQDVTAQITASGTYGVANLQTSLTSYGGWSLIVVVHDSTQPERSLMVAVPVGYVDRATPLKVTVPGASSAPTADLHLVVAAFEGDGQFAGDTVTVNGLDLGANPFRGAISGIPRNPELAVNYRVDVFDATVADVGAGDVTVAVATADDLVMVAAVGMALDLT